jgi:hypothetical protein
VTNSYFRELASRTRYAVVMASNAGCRVENRTQSGTCVVASLKLRLVERKGIAGRLCDPVADALGAGISSELPAWPYCQPQCRRGKAGRRFRRGLLGDEDNCGDGANDREENDGFISQRVKPPSSVISFYEESAPTEQRVVGKLLPSRLGV